MPGHTEPAIGRRRAPPSLHPAEAAQPLTDTDSACRRLSLTAKADAKAERVERQQVLASTDPTRRPLGETKLRDLTPDRVAVWSQGHEHTLAPGTALLALTALNPDLLT